MPSKVWEKEKPSEIRFEEGDRGRDKSRLVEGNDNTTHVVNANQQRRRKIGQESRLMNDLRRDTINGANVNKKHMPMLRQLAFEKGNRSKIFTSGKN